MSGPDPSDAHGDPGADVLSTSEQASNLAALSLDRGMIEAHADAIAGAAVPVNRVGVIGAGLMGSGIAQVLAARGLSVVLKDRDQAALDRGMAAIAGGLRQGPAGGGKGAGEAELETILARIQPTLQAEALRRVELVVEAVFEDLALKRAVLREVEEHAPDGVVFASNTSSIPIARIAEASRRFHGVTGAPGLPEAAPAPGAEGIAGAARQEGAAGTAGSPWAAGAAAVVGMHFFSPVPRMPLLEVIRHRRSSARAVATAVAVGRAMGKTVIVIEDGPGFFTTRVLAPLLNEAAWLLAEGASIEQVDRAMVAWGWPLGPFALLDEVGIDVGAHVAEVLHEGFGERLRPPPALARLAASGYLGRKVRAGFYLYPDPPAAPGQLPGRPAKGGEAPARQGQGRRGPRPVDERVYSLLGWQAGAVAGKEIAERCWLQMLDETARCLEEGVIASPAAADLAVVLGLGFPAFRGGVLRRADRVGLPGVVARLDGYAARCGSRFTAAPLLRDMAQRGEVFYPVPRGSAARATSPGEGGQDNIAGRGTGAAPESGGPPD